MNLTTLANVKEWGKITTDADDDLLNKLIVAASELVNTLIYVESLAWRLVTETYDGSGNNFMLLRQWPVTDVQSIIFDCGWSVGPSTPPIAGQPRTKGFILETPVPLGIQHRLDLYCDRFPRGRANVQISYHAGFLQSSEPQTVPSSGPYTLSTNLVWIGDVGVTYANGTALTPVPSSPAAGQYSVDALGNYTFAAADEGAKILISYSYCPPQLVQAVNEIVAERYKISANNRIGVSAMTVGGRESVTYFTQKDMNAFSATMIDIFRKTTPA